MLAAQPCVWTVFFSLTFRTHKRRLFRPGIAEPATPPNGVAGLKMYSAVLSTDNVSEREVDPEVEKFLPLLTEYLKSEIPPISIVTTLLTHAFPVHFPTKVNDIQPSNTESSSHKPQGSGYPGDRDDSDYVWDVFYHRPTTFSEWKQVANVGTLYVTQSFRSCVCLCLTRLQNRTSYDLHRFR